MRTRNDVAGLAGFNERRQEFVAALASLIQEAQFSPRLRQFSVPRRNGVRTIRNFDKEANLATGQLPQQPCDRRLINIGPDISAVVRSARLLSGGSAHGAQPSLQLHMSTRTAPSPILRIVFGSGVAGVCRKLRDCRRAHEAASRWRRMSGTTAASAGSGPCLPPSPVRKCLLCCVKLNYARWRNPRRRGNSCASLCLDSAL